MMMTIKTKIFNGSTKILWNYVSKSSIRFGRPQFPDHSSRNIGNNRFSSTGTTSQIDISKLIEDLSKLDTACICDADKMLLSPSSSNKVPTSATKPPYKGIRLLSEQIRPINNYDNNQNSTNTMVGIARTVRCLKRNDFLAVLRGLVEAQQADGDDPPCVLMVHTCDSNRAVAGEIFALAAASSSGNGQKQRIQGIVIDGPVRDTAQIKRQQQQQHQQQQKSSPVRVYASSVTPYSGTIQSPGELQVPILCGNITVRPTEDIVVGDDDGIVVATAETFATLLPHAQAIQEAEQKIIQHLQNGTGTLESLTNYQEHIEKRMQMEPSQLDFKV